MGHLKFLPKAIIVCFEEKKGFNYKDNHRCSKLANFWLDNISKINCNTLVFLSYISSGLRSKKIQLI